MDLLAHLVGVRRQQVACGLAELARNHDADRHDLIAVPGTAQPGHALAVQADLRARLRSRTQLDHLGFVHRGHLEAGAQRGLGGPDLQHVAQVVAVTHEVLVRGELEVHVQVAVRPAVHAGVALAGHAQPVAAVDPRGKADLDGVGLQRPSPPGAGGARGRDDLAGALAARARPRRHDGAEQRLRLGADLADAVAGGAGRLAVAARLGAVAFAMLAAGHALELDRDLRAFAGLLERDLDAGLEVLAGLALGTRPSGLREPASEHRAEDVEDVAAELDALVLAPEAVVAPALLAVGEHGVRLVDLLEPLLRLVVVRISVRVVLQGQLSVGGLDRRPVRVARYAQKLVVIGRHQSGSIADRAPTPRRPAARAPRRRRGRGSVRHTGPMDDSEPPRSPGPVAPRR